MKIALLRILAILALAPSAVHAKEPDAANGKHLFTTIGCSMCHGTTGSGGMYVGSRLTPDPLPTEAIAAYVRQPVPSRKLGYMPPYSTAILSDDEIADIAAYLRSIPKGKPASQIPMLNR